LKNKLNNIIIIRNIYISDNINKMGKNTKGGKNFKKQKKSPSNERELLFREDEQVYARIIKQFGDGRFECKIFNTDVETNLIGKICGSMRKRVWINIGDIVLVSTRDFDSSSCDIIHKYTLEEAMTLKSFDEIPSNINLQATELDLSHGNIECDKDYIRFEDI
jgi:translation initiation factor 1A